MRILRIRRVLHPVILAVTLVLASVASAACGSPDGSEGTRMSPSAVSNAGGLAITMYKSPSCGCCEGWAEYLEKHGFQVTSESTEDLESLNADLGVPPDLEPCHTAVISSYIVGGHIPVEFVTQLLEERPDIDGIALAGMPAGTPGMGGEKDGPLTIFAFKDGETSVFGEF